MTDSQVTNESPPENESAKMISSSSPENESAKIISFSSPETDQSTEADPKDADISFVDNSPHAPRRIRPFQRFSERLFPSGFFSSLSQLFHIAWPIMLSQLNVLLFVYVSTPFVGRLGSTAQLSAVGLGSSFANVAGMSIMWGLSTGAETLGSQAWGAGNKMRLGLICQRAFLVGLVAVLPCWAVYLNVGPVLTLLRQDPEVIHHVNVYIYAYLPALPFSSFYIAVMKFLQSQQVVLPVVAAGVIANSCNVLFHYLFVYVFGWALLGAALSTDLTILIFGLLMVLYIQWKGLHHGCWPGWTRECLRGWGEYLRFAVPGMLMICLEWWAFEIGMVTTGLLGKEYLAANTLCFSFSAYSYLVLSGVQIGTIILVGNYLGEGKGAAAMTVARVALICGVFVFGFAFFLIFYTLRHQLPWIFTADETVIRLTSEAMAVVALMQIVDGIVNTTSGILKGAGKQLFGAATNFFGYYFLGVPLGLTMMMDWGAGLKLVGYWWGQVIGLTFQAAVYFGYLTCKIDWNKTAEAAVARAKKTRGKEEEEEEKEEEVKVSRRRFDERLPLGVALLVLSAAFVASLILSVASGNFPLGIHYNVTEVDAANFSGAVSGSANVAAADPGANSTLYNGIH